MKINLSKGKQRIENLPMAGWIKINIKYKTYINNDDEQI